MEHPKNAERIWVIRSDRKTYPSWIGDVACKRDFYSDPSIDETTTLDYRITKYEDRLANLVNALRDLNVGAVAPTEVVAEIIAHLVPRAANIRNLLKRGLGGVVEGAASAFRDPQRVAFLLGIDGLESDDRFRRHLDEAIGKSMPAHNIPSAVFERVAFALVREGLPQTFPGLTTLMESLLQQFAALGGEMARASHAEALSQSLAHPTHQQDLHRFEWCIVAGPPSGSLLPDCVAIARRGDAGFTPYILTDRSDASAIVLPITSSKLVVGVPHGAELPDLSNFNEDAAACSESFVLSSRERDDVEHIYRLIGLRSSRVVDETISQVVESQLPHQRLDTAHVEERTIATSTLESFSVYFSDSGESPEVAQTVAQVIREIVTDYVTVAPLERLDGITFATDFQSAILKFDGRYSVDSSENAAMEAIDEGYAQAPTVLRDGTVKAHIIMRMELARALISDDGLASAVAMHALVFELAEVTFIDYLESAFPGILTEPFPDQHTTTLFLGVYPAIRSYFGARVSAGFAGPEYESQMREHFLRVLRHSDETMRREAAEYLQTNNMDRLFPAAMRVAARVLHCASSWIGHRAGLNLPIFESNDALESKMAEAKLLPWLKVFDADLLRIWERRGVWQSRSELVGMMCHAERILWAMNIFPSRQANGGTYVDLR